jgi:hypothetical protein
MIRNVLIAGVLFVAGCASMPDGPRAPRAFEAARDNPVALRNFLERFPKGADLHNHLSGAVYAESYIDWAAEDGLCVTPTLGLTRNCETPNRPASDALRSQLLYDSLVRSFSMREFVPTTDMPSGHAQFFSSFGRFGAVTNPRTGDMLAEVADRNARQAVFYLEPMVSYGASEAARRAAGLGPADDFAALDDRIRAAGVYDLIPAQIAELDRNEAAMRARLGCGGPAASPGCDVTLRYILQVNRNASAPGVFAQIALSMALIKADPRFAAVNLVAPEDALVARRDYTLHMRMLHYLGMRFGGAPVTLHAGELTLGLVPPADLKFHIRQAIEIGGARRIGHGVDLAYEDDMAGLLRLMAERRVLVEVNLTSNDVILGVKGTAHPFRSYRAAGVPVALSTDDEGVSRSDLTNEYQRAVQEQGVDYPGVKQLARNALEYSFLPGASLWQSPAFTAFVEACRGERPGGVPAGAGCRDHLAGSAKAREQWRHEGLIAAFEAGW